jgi:NAD(P)H-hydrate epimerase
LSNSISEIALLDSPLELMMENAGLNLAKLVATYASETSTILVRVGNGNNGGGGLVAARRLSAWGYNVFLDREIEVDRELPLLQLQRAIAFGCTDASIEEPEIWVDLYFGFSQRLPLGADLSERISRANNSKALRIALDIPTGYLGDKSSNYFKADKIVTLTSGKAILRDLEAELYVADLRIPAAVYQKFDTKILPFYKSTLLKIKQ